MTGFFDLTRYGRKDVDVLETLKQNNNTRASGAAWDTGVRNLKGAQPDFGASPDPQLLYFAHGGCWRRARDGVGGSGPMGLRTAGMSRPKGENPSGRGGRSPAPACRPASPGAVAAGGSSLAAPAGAVWAVSGGCSKPALLQ